MDAVGHVRHGNFVHRPARKERFEKTPAYRSMQTAHAVYRPAAADRQIRHIEIFGWVVRVLATECQQIVELYVKLLLGITAEVSLDECRRETVEAGGHRRVRGKEIARPGDGQGDFEGLPCRLHETARALQHGEGRMPFIQMA